MTALLDADPGRYLAFASSYDHASLIAESLARLETPHQIQARGMGRHAAHRLAVEFCTGPRRRS